MFPVTCDPHTGSRTAPFWDAEKKDIPRGVPWQKPLFDPSWRDPVDFPKNPQMADVQAILCLNVYHKLYGTSPRLVSM